MEATARKTPKFWVAVQPSIIRLYRKQLKVWVLGKIATLNDADPLRYDRRRDRIAQSQKELESMAQAA